MLYIIGLGLNENGISKEGLDIIGKCDKIYLEAYTVDFPYKIEDLERVVGKKIIKLERGYVEGSKLVDESKKEDIALLVYGSPLFATTHVSLIEDCKKNKVKYKVIYNASVFDALAESGLQLYKFGKTSSMPAWTESYKSDSFLDYVIENKKINAHSLMLVDIGLGFLDAVGQLEEICKRKKIEIDGLLVCSRLGCDDKKIFYGKINELKKIKKKIQLPFCFVVLGEMHFLEKEVVEGFKI